MIRDRISAIWKLHRFKRKWRNANKHNYTVPKRLFDMSLVTVGNASYGEMNVLTADSSAHLSIGSYCSIGENTTFILGYEHAMGNMSTYPFKVMALHSQETEALSKGNIVIDDDVWIGYGAIIMSGVHISQGAVIAAGAVVTSDVPSYAIVGGVPAKVIKYRFSDELIEALMKVDYKKLSHDMIASHIDDLYTPLGKESQLEWLPKK